MSWFDNGEGELMHTILWLIVRFEPESRQRKPSMPLLKRSLAGEILSLLPIA